MLLKHNNVFVSLKSDEGKVGLIVCMFLLSISCYIRIPVGTDSNTSDIDND